MSNKQQPTAEAPATEPSQAQAPTLDLIPRQAQLGVELAMEQAKLQQAEAQAAAAKINIGQIMAALLELGALGAPKGQA